MKKKAGRPGLAGGRKVGRRLVEARRPGTWTTGVCLFAFGKRRDALLTATSNHEEEILCVREEKKKKDETEERQGEKIECNQEVCVVAHGLLLLNIISNE